MKRFAAQYIITATGDILKRGVITTSDSGQITDIKDTGGNFEESASTPFYNGIIIPGFVNCHCHIELSDMVGLAAGGEGLGSFLIDVREKRNPSTEKALKAIKESDSDIYRTGTSAVADICNRDLSFQIKDNSPIDYINLLEVFGVDPARAENRIEEIESLKRVAEKYSTPHAIVPHSVYSISQPLLNRLSTLISKNSITSIHFLESEEERQLVDHQSGKMIDSYRAMGIDTDKLDKSGPGHIETVLNHLPKTGNLILVHNTFATAKDITDLQSRDGLFWCLCTNSNLYIENTLPPVEELRQQDATIVIGTDSLASNRSLNIFDELLTLQNHFPAIELSEMIGWVCRNGAIALGMDHLGTIEKGKTPGLVLIENCDLENIRLTEKSRSRRLI